MKNRIAILLIFLLIFQVIPSWAQPDGGGNLPATLPSIDGGSLTALSSEEHPLRPGDRIEFNIAALPEVPTIYDIRVDGHFYHPLVGDVEASGRTLKDLRGVLEDRLSKELRNPAFRLGIIRVAQHSVAVL